MNFNFYHTKTDLWFIFYNINKLIFHWGFVNWTSEPISKPSVFMLALFTAISVSPFQFLYQKASPTATSEKTLAILNLCSPRLIKVWAISFAAGSPVISLPE